MDSQENANTQTKEQPPVIDDKNKTAEESGPQVAPPVKPEKPKPTYKCLVCGKS